MFEFNLQLFFVLAFIVIIWLLGVTFFLYKSVSHYNRLVKGKDKKTLTELLEKILKESDATKEEIEDLKKKVNQIEDQALTHIHKIGLVKFNPFKDIGGKQSFILSLLDGKDSGVVITSLHGRQETRWYVKMIKEGKGVNYELSKEEIEAIKKAGKI